PPTELRSVEPALTPFTQTASPPRSTRRVPRPLAHSSGRASLFHAPVHLWLAGTPEFARGRITHPPLPKPHGTASPDALARAARAKRRASMRAERDDPRTARPPTPGTASAPQPHCDRRGRHRTATAL